MVERHFATWEIMRSIPRLLQRFSVPLIVTTVAIVIQFSETKTDYQYNPQRIDDGLWWLLITGHLAHLSWPHLLLNCVALFVIWQLFFLDQRQFHIQARLRPMA